ncbi:MAG: CBS domain-containing protein [Bacillota bacterium]
MFVGNAMTRQVKTVSPDAALGSVWETMQAGGYEAIPVRDGRRNLVGMVTAFDIAAQILSGREADSVRQMKVAEVMTTEVAGISEDEILEEAAAIMYRNDYYALPVIADNGVLVGIITQADVGRMFVEMMGFTQPGSRITMVAPDRTGVLAEIAQIIKSCAVSISSMATLVQEDRTMANVIVRLKTDQPRDVVERLRHAGYRVLHVSQVWE